MHVHKTKVTRPRPRRYIFKTETRRDVPKKRLETASRLRRSKDRDYIPGSEEPAEFQNIKLRPNLKRVQSIVFTPES